MKLGISGRLTQATLHSPLTPLFLLAAIAMGLLALMSIPREEEPQISVPMVDIMVAAPGLRAPDAVELVGKPAAHALLDRHRTGEQAQPQAQSLGVLAGGGAVQAGFEVHG